MQSRVASLEQSLRFFDSAQTAVVDMGIPTREPGFCSLFPPLRSQLEEELSEARNTTAPEVHTKKLDLLALQNIADRLTVDASLASHSTRTTLVRQLNSCQQHYLSAQEDTSS